jgi:XTP/dITP diphosphohydrolase
MNISELIFATSNPNKVKEVNELLPDHIQVLSLKDIQFNDELPETQETIEGNAIQKAETLFKLTNKNCFAEDTGLIVPSLNGEPGVYSARYAGPQKNDQDNMNLLLQKLEDKKDRSAYFKTVIALFIDGKHHTFEGRAEGKIIFKARGEHGFGYDPIFLPDGYESTFAEMTMLEKGEISHRARALKLLISHLGQI